MKLILKRESEKILSEKEFHAIMMGTSAEIDEVSEAEGKLLPEELNPLSAFDINAIED